MIDYHLRYARILMKILVKMETIKNHFNQSAQRPKTCACTENTAKNIEGEKSPFSFYLIIREKNMAEIIYELKKCM